MRNQVRVRGRRLSGVVLLALALATLVSVLAILPSRSASAVSPSKADYRFQGKRSTSVGSAPVLQDIGPNLNKKPNFFTTATVDGSSRKVLSFPKGNGLKLAPTTNVVPNNSYTIVVLFELNNVGNDESRFRRVVDFKNGTSDNGLYIEREPVNGTSRLSFYRQGLEAEQGSTPIAANRYVQVVITRDALGNVKGYVDGTKQFEFGDTASDAVISANNTLRFFKDNTSEDSGGSVARIRLFDSALSDAEVGALDRLEPTVFKVNSNADLGDSNLVDGKCLTVNPNECTLRAAIQQTNKTSGDDTINFASIPSGTITLTGGQHISIDSEPDSLTINGPGARVLTVSGNNASRVFFIADDASAAINNLRISNGNATTNGGGISADGDLLTLTNVTVSGNSATSAGGGIYNSGNDLTLNNSTVGGGNRVTNGVGGGIYNSGNDLTLNNSTVSGNLASSGLDPSFGGGIANGGTLTLNNSTVSGNQVNNGDGGGIRNFSGTTSSRNTIVANNAAATGPDVSGTFSSQGNNLVESTSGASGFGGSDVLGKDPRLGTLDNNGGPTDTHALLSKSPATDRAPNTNCPSKDQRGVSRPKDGDGNGRARCDIGAYEKKQR